MKHLISSFKLICSSTYCKKKMNGYDNTKIENSTNFGDKFNEFNQIIFSTTVTAEVGQIESTEVTFLVSKGIQHPGF